MTFTNKIRLQSGKLQIPLRGNRSLVIPVLLIPVLACAVVCLCCFGWLFADASLRAAGILPTYTPSPTPTSPATATPSPTKTVQPTPTPSPYPTDTPEASPANAPPSPTATRSPATATTAPTITTMPPTITPAPTSVPATAVPVAICEMSAWVNDEFPAQRQHVYVYGKLTCNDQPVTGAAMHVTWHYKSTTATCAGTTGGDGIAACERSIGGAAKGYTVRLDVTITHDGKTYRATTAFTPQ